MIFFFAKLSSVNCFYEDYYTFLWLLGSMSEGIYRRSGANSNVTKLLALFRTDAWAVQLSRQDFTEYDVASVLKRWFIELPDPLLTAGLHKYFCNAASNNFILILIR